MTDVHRALSFRSRTSRAGLFAVSPLLLAGLAATQTTFQDGTFDRSDWTGATPCSASQGTALVDQRDGFPAGNDYLWVSHLHNPATSSGPTQLATVVTWPSFRYAPAIQGGLEAVDVRFDARLVSPNPGPGPDNLVVAPVVEQGGVLYLGSALRSTQIPAWSVYLFSDLRAGSFSRYTPCNGPGSGRPDFSCSGAPLVFGLLFASTHTGSEITGGEAGVDQLTVNFRTGVGSFRNYGSGCGPGGSPLSFAAPLGAPTCGQTTQLELDVVPASTTSQSAVMMLGLPRNPPFDLSILGLRNCSWYVDGLDVVYAVGAGRNLLTLSVPTGINGLVVDAQVLTVGSYGYATSPAARMTIY